MVEEDEHPISTKDPTRSSPTLGIHVAEPFGTSRRMGKRQETGAFKPVLRVG